MNDLKKAFGHHLREIRKDKKYTQEVLAEMIDLSPRQLIRIENGENFPSIETISRISQIFGLDLSNLFNFKWNDESTFFLSGGYNKPSLKAIKHGENINLIPLASSSNYKFDFNFNNSIKVNEYESLIFKFCKQNNKSITVEIFEDDKRMSVKTFYPENKVEELLSTEKILKNEMYNYILSKLKTISSDSRKLSYIKLAIDSLEDKTALEKLILLLQGMDLVS